MIFTTVKLDKARNIVLGFKAMQEFKNITGNSLTKIDFESEDLEVEEIVPVIFYAGLKHEDNSLTLEKTTELLDEHLGIKGAIELIPQIMQDAFGVQEKK
ncbi:MULTISPECIES: hypothetical protein [Clostridia]|uniref:Uncharacterized protein n=2 Tax=Clostridia TaxID=186801 RepID=A0A8I0DLI5_9CLOT|nr:MULTISPECIES: hypothetical protein [Clostridia]MBC5640208.1 hypothetical protein [Clostridium lentum]MBC5654426.1 hypothetical protein [Blautia lenta]